MLSTSNVRVVVWEAGDLHVESHCPAAALPGIWVEAPPAALESACSVCSPRAAFVRFAGSFEDCAAARMASCLDAVVSSVVLASTGNASALLRANLALVLGASAAHDLGVTAPFQTSHATLRSLRREFSAEFEYELARRTYTSSPRSETNPPKDLSTQQAWRAVRWAVRNGIDPFLATAHIESSAVQTAEFLAEVALKARGMCVGPRHVMLGSTESLPSGVLAELVASSGALGDSYGATGATVLPRQVAYMLNAVGPGVRLADAGEIEENEVTDELLRLTAGLWRPHAGALSDARVALSVARGLAN
jgi:hypothetical protein